MTWLLNTLQRMTPNVLLNTGEGKGEPALEENLQEKASGIETTEPFIVEKPDDDMTTVTAFGVSSMTVSI